MRARVLHLVSPHMTGLDVRQLQHALAAKGFYSGAVDGEYGPLTAQAVYRAKRRLGYRKGEVDRSAGATLLAYLEGHRSLSVAMRARAKLRARPVAAAQKKTAKRGLTAGQLVVRQALTQLGQTESPPGSNRSRFSLWYGIVGAWCAMFVTWVFTMSKFGRSFVRSKRYAYVPYIVHDAIAGVNGLMLESGPADGRVVCFDWDGDSVADHVGICAEEETLKLLAPAQIATAIRQFGPLGAGEFWTVEGNTGIGNDSNGGMVMIRKRPRSLVRAFVKVAA